jgi:hypothetical protein
MQGLPTREQFAEQAGSTFKVTFGPESTVEMRLVEVNERKRDERRDAFSLLFLAPPETPVCQNLFAIEHPVLGTMELLLVPVGGDDQGIKYEAVFNLIVEPGADHA